MVIAVVGNLRCGKVRQGDRDKQGKIPFSQYMASEPHQAVSHISN